MGMEMDTEMEVESNLYRSLTKNKSAVFGWGVLLILIGILFLGFLRAFITPDPNDNYIILLLMIFDFISNSLSILNPILIFIDFQFQPIFGGGRNLFIWRNFATAAIITFQVWIISLAIGFIMAVLLAVILSLPSKIPGLKGLAQAYVDIFRSTPLLVQILIIFLGVPQFIQSFGEINLIFTIIPLGAPHPINERFILTPFNAGIIALTLNTAAYQAEIIRAGIEAIPTGQTEASRGLGMTTTQTMRFVILPQALRLVIPPYTNEGISLLLNTSLVSIITIRELTQQAGELSSFYFNTFEVFMVAGLFYFVIAYSLARISKRIEKKYKIPGLGMD